MTAGEGPVQAAIYCRISLAVMGDMTKVDEQEAQCREVCRRHGWEVAAVFKDNSRSAWQRNRKRDGWDEMLEAIRAGRFGALVSYWGDRIVRQPRDLEDLLDLRDVRQISLASVAGRYDFDNKDHRMMMRWEVARACNESDTISQRVSNNHALRRAQGLTRPGGRDGACGTPMLIKPSKGRGQKNYQQGYACPLKGCGKAYRSATHLDAYVSSRVIARLGNPFNPEPQAPREPAEAAEWGELAAERAETERIARDYRASAGMLGILAARLDAIDARMAELRDRDAGDSRQRLLERYAGITREEWEDDDRTPLSVRRALVAACYRVTVLPASGRGPGFRVQDVRLEPA